MKPHQIQLPGTDGRHHSKWLSVLIFCLLLLYSPLQADSVVYIQNNTIRTLNLKTDSNLGSEYWSASLIMIGPGERRELLRFNRDKGITNGKRFYFNTEVRAQGSDAKPVILRQQLLGSLVGSHMWQSIKGDGWEDDDGKIHNKAWVIGKNKFHQNIRLNVKYWSYFTGGDSDIEYVFQEDYPLPDGNYVPVKNTEFHKHHLDILSYNIYMRPTNLFVNGQGTRVKQIPAKVRGYDVVLFNEAFDDDIRGELVAGMKASGYPHVSRILGEDHGTTQDGGVIFFSKWPIEDQQQRLFKSVCSGDDCHADKGVLYIRINKLGKKYHLFGTHLNNGDQAIQLQQCRIMRRFVQDMNIPWDQPVILAGDFNVDRHEPKYEAMMDALNAFNTADPQDLKYSNYESINKLLPGTGSNTQLDYILRDRNHVKPNAAQTQIRMLRTNFEWKDLPHEKAIWELSDHFPIYGSMDFYDPESTEITLKRGIKIRPLVRYWSKNLAEVAESNKKIPAGLEMSGYTEIGRYGYLFKDSNSAKKWVNFRDDIKLGDPTIKPYTVRARAAAGPKPGNTGVSSTKTDPMATGSINPKKYPDYFALKLYYSEKKKDYWAVTPYEHPSPDYKLVGTLGYLLSSYAYLDLTAFEKAHTLAVYAYYHTGRKDHLLAVSEGDRKGAEAAGYRFSSIVGYLIKP